MSIKIIANTMRSRKFLALAATAVVLSACAVTTGTVSGGIGFEQDRSIRLAQAREYRVCTAQALQLDKQAKADASAARYLASARLLEKCETQVGPDVDIPDVERMRNYALSVQNHFKGGDVATAQANLEKMKAAFPDKDIYFADGSSFFETMEILMGLKDRSAAGAFSVVNVNSDVKAELRRVRYWKRN